MKKIDFGHAVATVANVGVLIGILLLVYELNQNREMMQAQIRSSIADTLTNMRHSEALSTDLLEMEVKVTQGTPLSPIDEARFDALWTAYIRYWENVHYQYRKGLYEESEYFAQREAWRRILREIDGVRDLWCGRTAQRSPEFVGEVDSLLDEPC